MNNIIDIKNELKNSYLDYAMSVIVDRALPDIKDGLKPVHRRILYVMKELGNTFDNGYKKSARIVGDVIGKYHPHGESAVYDSIVRMSQNFVQRYPLIDGQGNFGSIDGDAPAAMRYTEIRMSEISNYLLKDLDCNTVDFIFNYDNTETQPVILPAIVPNLLINGSSGIAVGMATNIPPHNINEVINACLILIKKPNIEINELMEYIHGPDFPTYGKINGIDGILNAYKTGKGKICIRANARIECDKLTDNYSIIINELPYQVNKSKLIEKITLLIREKKLSAIKTLRDESDKDGLRIFIGLHKNKDPNVVLNNLYSLTNLELSFGINMVALVNSKPKLLNLKDILNYFIIHRKKINYRKYEFKLKKSKEKIHILEGLSIILLNINYIVDGIKSADSIYDLKNILSGKSWNISNLFKFISKEEFELCRHPDFKNSINNNGYYLSDIQVQSILDLKLYKLTKMEINVLLKEYIDVMKNVKNYISILKNESNLLNIVTEELLLIQKKFSDPRRTEIFLNKEKIKKGDLIFKERIIITLSSDGYIKIQLLDGFQTQRRKGRGRLGVFVEDNDYISNLIVTDTHKTLLCFSNYGKMYWLNLSKLFISSKATKGAPIINLLNLEESEKIKIMLAIDVYDNRFLFMVTRNGLIKKNSLFNFKNERSNGIIAINLSENDILVDVKVTKVNEEVMLFSKNCKAIKILSDKIRCTGRITKGMIGMRLNENDDIISLTVLNSNKYILSVTGNGFGKRTCVSEYYLGSRGRKGIISMKSDRKIGNLISTECVGNEDELILITNKGIISRIKVNEIPITKRNTKGVLLINLKGREFLVNVRKI